MRAPNDRGPALATPALEDKPLTTSPSVHLPALQPAARAIDLHEVDAELRAGVAQDAVIAQRQRWDREHRRPPALSLREAATAVRFEALFVWTCAGNLRNGVELRDADFARLTLAASRIEDTFEEALR